MATLRDLIPGYAPELGALIPGTSAAPQPAGLRAPDAQPIDDAAAVANMGQLRRGFASGRLGTEANALRAEQAGLRADGMDAAATALEPRVQAVRGRAATFAPTEQDVTALGWNPGRIVDWGLGAVGQAGASMLDPIALGAAANAAGSVVGMIPHPAAKLAGGALRLGGMAGGFGLNAQQAKGEFVEDAYNDPALMVRTTPQALNTAANFSGAVSGAADSIFTGAAAGRLVGRPTMKALAGLSMPAKVGVDVAGEGLTEVAQGEIKRGTLGFLNPDRDTSGDANDRWNDLAAGMVGAAPISVASQYAAAGHRRLGVADDMSSDDVSGGRGTPRGTPPAKENLSERLVRGAKAHADDDAAEAWNNVLLQGTPDAAGSDDLDATTKARHDALLKELSGRAEKGDATAQQFAETLSAMDPANPASWYDDTPREAAYKHLLGDGTDRAKVIEAYKGRKLNAQGTKAAPAAELATTILQSALPAGDADWEAASRNATADFGRTLSDFAAQKGQPRAIDIDRALTTAGRMVNAYGLAGARSAVARVAMALGAEKAPAFQMLQKHLSAADMVQLQRDGRKTRLGVADEMAKAIPTDARLALLKEGADLTEPNMRRALLDLVQEVAQKTGYGAVNPATGEPIVVKPSAYANLTSRLGPNGAAVAKTLLDMVAPGKVEEKEGAGEKKISGGGKTGAATESDDVGSEQGLTDDLSRGNEGDTWEAEGALKNIERAPGSKLYLAKGRSAVSSTEGSPFVPDRKTKNLPTLSTLDDTDDGKGPAGSGPKTLESMIAKAWLALGGQEFNDPDVKVERATGVTRRTTTMPDPMRAVPSVKAGPRRPGEPEVQGVGSYRIRATSAREVMEEQGVSPSRRVELLKDYLARPGKRGASPVLAKDDPTIQQLATLDRKIKVREKETPKSFGTGVARNGSPLPTVENPAYVELQDLKGQRKEVMGKLAAKIGVEISEDATVPELADAYFDSRYLVTAEQMAEKDQLRLDVAEVRAMVRRGNNDLDFTDQFGENKVEVQAGMNLLRFKSKSAVAGDGVAVIRANDLVEWVRDNRNDKAPPKSNSPERAAIAFRNDLMEGIGALAADGYLGEMPYMINEQGKKESFAKGFPPTLRLSGLTQGALDARKAERAKRVQPFVGPPDVDAVAREQAEGSIDPDPAVRRDEDRAANQSLESEGIPNEFRNQGVERGKADRKVSDRAPAEKFWDAPELTLTRTDANLVPSETEPREQRKGVPTERTDIAMRTATINSALDGVDTLTMANAPARAQRMADKLWAGLGRSHPDSSVKANPAAGWQNVLNVFKTLRSGKLQYAAPLAHLLTPAHVQRLTETAKDPAKAAPMLRGLVGEVAAALADMPDSGFSRAEKTTLARLLTGNEKLVAPAVNGALKAMAPKAEPTPKPDAAASRVDVRVMKEDYNLRVEQVRPFLLAAQARLAQLEQMRRDNDQENLPADQETVLRRLRELFGPNSDLTMFYTEAPGFAGMEPADRQQAIRFAEGLTAPAKKNAQATASNATGVYSDAEVAKAKAHFAKVLGPKVTVLANETFPDAGEWSDAEQTARLSTAIGPGVLSVAYHESMHGLWGRLIKNSPSAAKILAKVASDPRTLERLQAELANEPAASAQIADGAPNSQEERVAYMYQFWAAGLLDVDKPATSIFAKMRKMLRKVLGMVRESETALELMTAFHDGKLAEPSAAGRVIDKIMKTQTWNEDVKRKFDKQVQGVFAAITPSNQVLRKEELSVTARRLGVMMFTNPGEELAGRFKKGYLNARRTKTSQFTNYLYDAIKGLSPRDMEAVVEELQLQRKPEAANLPYAPVRQAVERVQALTARYWDYATKDAGMKLEFLGEYHYPRVWSLNALIEDGGKDKFIAMLTQPKYAGVMKSATDMANENRSKPYTTVEVAEQMYQYLVDKNGVDDKGLDAERAQNDLLAPFFASQKERSFKWLDNEDVRPFLEKDLVGAMSRYLHQGVRAAEYVRRFGEGGKDLKEMLAMKGDEWVNPETERRESRPDHGAIAGEIVASLKEKGVTGKEADEILARHMEDIKNSVEAHEGSLGRDISPTWRKASSLAMAYQNLRLLPLSLFAAFGDTIGIAGRFGEGGGKLAFQAFLQGLKDVYARWKTAASDMPADRQKTVWEDIAEMIGAVDSHMFLEQLGKAHTSEFMTDLARRTNRALFMANGLTAWDRSMRVSGTKAAVLFLQHHASLPDKQHSKRWLAELGLAPKDIPLDADGKLITDRHVLAAAKGIDLDKATAEMDRVHTALVRWVEGAVLTPNAGQRPTWASDPHYAVLFHLKQFTYSFQDTILRRAFNEASHGNMNPIGALAAAVPTMVAADMVKGLVVGGGSFPAYMKAWDAGDWIQHGIQRAGHLGVAQFGVDAMSDPTSLLGPTVDQATDFIWKPTEVLGNIHNAIPGVRMIRDVPDFVRVTG